MTHNDIRNTFNHFLAGEMITWKEMVPHLNYAIDDINTQLNSVFPEFSINQEVTEYTAFPDKYIRSVVLPGAIWHFYMVDEEGATMGQQFQMDYSKNLFYMLRDYSALIPVEYQASNAQGSVTSGVPTLDDDRGLWINGNDLYI